MRGTTIHIRNSNVRPHEVSVMDGVGTVHVHIEDERIEGLRPTWTVFTLQHGARSDVQVATGECGCP